MKLLTHCCRIELTKPRRHAPGRTAAAAASFAVLAMSSLGSVALINAAFAQTPGTAGPVSLGELFDGEDSRRSDTRWHAKIPGSYPEGAFSRQLSERHG